MGTHTLFRAAFDRCVRTGKACASPLSRLVLAGWIATLAAAAHAATPVWINWSSDTNGKTHTYAAGDYRLTLSSKPAPDGGNPIPVLNIAVPGAPAVTLKGVAGFETAGALVGVVQLDPKAARPAVLMQTFSGGAHCCTTLKLALLSDGAWRAYALTFDGGPGEGIVDAKDGAPPLLLIGDANFDYAFASHAGSYLPPRAYAVRGGRLYDVSGEPRMAGRWRGVMSSALGGCSDTTADDRNGACAAYAAAASLLGQHAAAWKRMLTIYDRTAVIWPKGCRVYPGAGDCPKARVLEFKSYTASLAWFLWRYGYFPPAPTFECLAPSCPVAWPSSPPPAGDGPNGH